MTLYWKNGQVATTDGPYAETKEQLGGIQIYTQLIGFSLGILALAIAMLLTYGSKLT